MSEIINPLLYPETCLNCDTLKKRAVAGDAAYAAMRDVLHDQRKDLLVARADLAVYKASVGEQDIRLAGVESERDFFRALLATSEAKWKALEAILIDLYNHPSGESSCSDVKWLLNKMRAPERGEGAKHD